MMRASENMNHMMRASENSVMPDASFYHDFGGDSDYDSYDMYGDLPF